jgi:biopolymer transport protein ExbD/biopolymer transport protein TolR
MSDINMTPLIDVMLVLLVIFMLTAPLMTSSLKLNLPKAEGVKPQAPNPEAIRLTLLASGELRWGDETIDLGKFKQRLLPLKGGDTEVHLKADQAVPYGRVAELLGLLQQAQLQRIAFLADKPGVVPTAPAQP